MVVSRVAALLLLASTLVPLEAKAALVRRAVSEQARPASMRARAPIKLRAVRPARHKPFFMARHEARKISPAPASLSIRTAPAVVAPRRLLSYASVSRCAAVPAAFARRCSGLSPPAVSCR